MLCPILVGRDAELAALEAVLAEATAHGGRVALLAGDAGIGKSRLLQTFLSRVRASGGRTVIGHCVEAEARRPFGPFIDALRAAPIESDGALAEPDGRYRALRSFATIVGELAKQAPLVLAIDDLQWADEGTLELFEYLSRTLREKHVLLVGAYRSDELHRLHPLRAVLATLARTRTADSVILRPLSVADTSELVVATLGLTRAAPKDLVAALADRCEGNPFYLEEMLKALAEAGTLARRDGSWQHDGRIADLAVPASVRDVVQARLALLPRGARVVLQVAAVIGTSFDLALLQQSSAMTDERLTSALRAAVEGQFVEEVSDAAIDHFRFRHALTREAVLADMLGRERRALHGKVAAAIEAVPGPADRAEALAYHFDEAGDAARAYPHHLRASEQATAIYAFGQARRHLERALELAPGDSDLAGLNSRLSRASLQSGDGRGALRAAEEARARYEQRADARGIGLALCEISDAYWYLGQAGDAWRAAEESVRVLESLGTPCELSDAYRRMADLALFNDDPRTEYWAERTIESARRCGQRTACPPPRR
jgi:predicted ATPase